MASNYNIIQYENAIERALTFEDVDKSTPIYKLKDQLVRKGFFATGNHNETECYACGGRFDQWREGDEVESVHFRDININCRLVQRRQGSHQFESGNTVPRNVSEDIVDIISSSNNDIKSTKQPLIEINQSITGKESFETIKNLIEDYARTWAENDASIIFQSVQRKEELVIHRIGDHNIHVVPENPGLIHISSSIILEHDNKCEKCRIKKNRLTTLPCKHRICLICHEEICKQSYPHICPIGGCVIEEYEPL